MCLMQNKAIVPEVASPCMNCPLYLETCSPVVDHGYLAGAECDADYCTYCPYADDCDGV